MDEKLTAIMATNTTKMVAQSGKTIFPKMIGRVVELYGDRYFIVPFSVQLEFVKLGSCHRLSAAVDTTYHPILED